MAAAESHKQIRSHRLQHRHTPDRIGTRDRRRQAPVAHKRRSGRDALIVKYTPAGGSGSTATLEQTTGNEGCVVFGGIPATSALVEIPETTGLRHTRRRQQIPVQEVSSQEVKIAPNYTTHHEVLYNRGGAIKAEFDYNGSKIKHLNNEGKTTEIEEAVKGDTFVAFNSKMEARQPEFEVGQHQLCGRDMLYNPLPSVSTKASLQTRGYHSKHPVPIHRKRRKRYWNVYAGDCAENNPEKLTGKAILPTKIYRQSRQNQDRSGCRSATSTLNLYKPNLKKRVNKHLSERWKDLETTTSRPVTITNTKCAGQGSRTTSRHPPVKHARQRPPVA